MANLRVDKITSTETFETTGSVQFDGDADYLEASNSDDFQLGTGDFTVEAWVLANDNSGSRQIISMSDGSENWQLFTHSGGTIRWNSKGTNDSGTIQHDADAEIDAKIWNHIAATRSGNTLRLFKNGIVVGTFGYNSDLTLSAGGPSIGIWDADKTSEDWQGHISNVRIIKGKALYTANFKPPMRELEVVPGTVLLACQSKTDATLEKTGKTLTVGGNAVASELTPGILTPVVKSGGGSAITGSVEFDGTGDYLSLAANSDFNFGSDNFTIEGFFYKGGATTNQTLLCSDKYYIAGNDGNWILRITSGTQIAFASYNGTGSEEYTEFSAKSDDGGWHHFAFVREGTGSNQSKFYFDGVHRGSMTVSKSLTDAGTNGLRIGEESDSGPGNNFMNGFLSNIRINKGTALYTADFIPPTRELKNVPGTVLLCCQDENSVTTEVTGKTITSNGDPAASNFTPQVGDDRQVTFEGVTKINTDAYFYLPTGDTASREATGSYNAGTRGVAMGGDAASPNPDTIIDYITIASTGDAKDFGDLTVSDSLNGDAVADHTRGVCLGGRSNVPTPNSTTNAIQFVTISSTGNSQDFGDLVGVKYGMAGFSDSTRGIAAGGGVTPNSTANIDYITISSKGNGQDFGDCTDSLTYSAGFSSPTRGIKAGGGETPGSAVELNLIEYVTIQTTGNGQDFGDLITPAWRLAGCSNAVRGVILEGESPAGDGLNAISFVTIASMGNAQEFGDATTAGQHSNGTSSSTRGVFMGRQGASPYANLTFIDFVHIMTTANAQDFGDLTIGRQGVNACSNGHGGLG